MTISGTIYFLDGLKSATFYTNNVHFKTSKWQHILPRLCATLEWYFGQIPNWTSFWLTTLQVTLCRIVHNFSFNFRQIYCDSRTIWSTHTSIHYCISLLSRECPFLFLALGKHPTTSWQASPLLIPYVSKQHPRDTKPADGLNSMAVSRKYTQMEDMKICVKYQVNLKEQPFYSHNHILRSLQNMWPLHLTHNSDALSKPFNGTVGSLRGTLVIYYLCKSGKSTFSHRRKMSDTSVGCIPGRLKCSFFQLQIY